MESVGTNSVSRVLPLYCNGDWKLTSEIRPKVRLCFHEGEMATNLVAAALPPVHHPCFSYIASDEGLLFSQPGPLCRSDLDDRPVTRMSYEVTRH